MSLEEIKKGDKVMFLGNLDHDLYWKQGVAALDLHPLQIVKVVGIFRGLLSIDPRQPGVLLPPEYFQKVEENYGIHKD